MGKEERTRIGLRDCGGRPWKTGIRRLWLEARAACDRGKIDEKAMKAMKALRRGWYLGEPTFGDKLLGMLKKPSAKKKSRASEAPKAHGEAEAGRLVDEAMLLPG